jgi:hypothetical protein
MGKSLIIKGADFSQNGIVPDFIQLDWIEGSDTDGRGILSNILNKVNLSYECIFTCWKDPSATPQQTSVYLPGNDMNTNSRLGGWSISGSLHVYWGTGDHSFSAVYDNAKHIVFSSKAKMKLDNTEYVPETQPTFSNAGGYIGLDCKASYANGNVYIGRLVPHSSSSKIKIHGIKIWDGETLVLDVIPVKRTADNVVCFYDKVQDRYFERNDGSTPVYGEL